MSGERDVVVVEGLRTPFVKAGTLLRDVPAAELGRIVVREALERSEIDPGDVDEVVVGNIAAPADAANVARVVALLAKIPKHVPAFTISRNCASGLDAVVEAAYRIRSGDADLMVAAAVESMSRIPILFGDDTHDLFAGVARARSLGAKLGAMARFRPRHFRPVFGLELGLRDAISGLNMGETAEVLAKEFGISREEQDAFALRSHQRAAAAWREGRLQEEIVPVPIPPRFDQAADQDNGIREGQSSLALAKLRPIFDRKYGSVTAGNSSQITDGAVALILASRRRARELSLPILGRIRSWGFAGCDPARMGLGPVLAAPVALRRAGLDSMERIERFEVNEAFAAQVLACLRAFESRKFFQDLRATPVGAIDPERLNGNGGAIALGHPVGASGARLVLTLLRELERRDETLGMAALCVGGGQGAAMIVERS